MGLTPLLVGTAATATAAATTGLIGTAGAISTGAAIGIGALAGAAAGGAFSKPDRPDLPAVTAKPTAKTAKRIEPVTDLDARKKRRAASIFTRTGFAEPKLAKPGLLGLGS